MSSRLDRITDWPKLAQEARYSAMSLAKNCGVSVRQLERYIEKVMRKPPHPWLNYMRQHKALEHLRDGCTVKETAVRLGYKNQANFSREFKKVFGFPPSEHAKQPAQRPAAR